MTANHYVLYKRDNGIWYYYLYRDGQRVRRSTGETRKRRAQHVVETRLANEDLLAEREKARHITFGAFAEPFWDYDRCPIIQDKIKRGGSFSRDFAYARRLDVQKYMVPTFGKILLSDITPAQINNWILSLPERFNIKPQTANKQLVTLREMLDEAVHQNLIEVNPASSVKPLVQKEERRGCFTQEQVDSLFKEAGPDPVAELACYVAALTGMRLAEVRGLQKDQVHDGCITVDRSYNDIEKVKGTKSGKARVVPIPPDLEDRLQKQAKAGPFLINYTGGKPLLYDYRALACADGGVQD